MQIVEGPIFHKCEVCKAELKLDVEAYPQGLGAPTQYNHCPGDEVQTTPGRVIKVSKKNDAGGWDPQ